MFSSLLAFVAIPPMCHATDVEQHLRDEYLGKVFILRGFQANDIVRYDSSGSPLDSNSGDWTTDGFVLVTSIKVSEQRMEISARRLAVIFRDGQFRYFAKSPKEKTKKAPPVAIEVDMASPDQADAALSAIFLTAHDNLADLVPGFWKPCVEAASTKFSAELRTVPGVSATAEGTGGCSLPTRRPNGATHFVGARVSPPRALFSPQPAFDPRARQAGYSGSVTLVVVVSEGGIPRDIHVAVPLGYGLDAKAVEAVQSWKFSPSQKDGHPVPVEVSLVVEFHLY